MFCASAASKNSRASSRIPSLPQLLFRLPCLPSEVGRNGWRLLHFGRLNCQQQTVGGIDVPGQVGRPMTAPEGTWSNIPDQGLVVMMVGQAWPTMRLSSLPLHLDINLLFILPWPDGMKYWQYYYSDTPMLLAPTTRERSRSYVSGQCDRCLGKTVKLQGPKVGRAGLQG